jgi:hypothetical protein
MGYTRITIELRDGNKRSGVRAFAEPINLKDIHDHVWRLASEVLGRNAIENVIVTELPATVPAVVALLLGQKGRNESISRSNGEHPFAKGKNRPAR